MLVSERYNKIWEGFASDLSAAYKEMGQIDVMSDTSLHEGLRSIYWTPYNKIHNALEEPVVDCSSENIGAVTGVFFEQACAALIVPRIRNRVSGVRIERNTCSNDEVSKVARDPDIFASANGKHIVIELKISPKKRELLSVLSTRKEYQSIGVAYYFIGGYVISNPELLGAFIDDSPWACFLDSSARNQDILDQIPVLDSVIDDIVSFLSQPR